MKVYRILFAVLLGATLAQTAPVAAQEQEDHIVVRRRYALTEEPEKPVNNSPWYNNITFNLAHGLFIRSDIAGFKDAANNINIGNRHQEWIGTAFAFGFERLYRKDRLVFGPGVHVKWGGYLSTCFDFYAHGQFELGGTGEFMGYTFKRVHPFAGASLGLSYMQYENYSFGYPWYSTCSIEYIRETNGSVRVQGEHFKQNAESGGKGIRLYTDLDLGFVIDITHHSAISISYHAVLSPLVDNYFDFNDYADEVRAIATTPHSGYVHETYYFDMETRTGLSLQHGLQIAFRF